MLVYKTTYEGLRECCFGKNAIVKLDLRLKSICVVQLKNFKFVPGYGKAFNMGHWVNSNWFIFKETNASI